MSKLTLLLREEADEVADALEDRSFISSEADRVELCFPLLVVLFGSGGLGAPILNIFFIRILFIFRKL
jgi:hypothetical protein